MDDGGICIFLIVGPCHRHLVNTITLYVYDHCAKRSI